MSAENPAYADTGVGPGASSKAGTEPSPATRPRPAPRSVRHWPIRGPRCGYRWATTPWKASSAARRGPHGAGGVGRDVPQHQHRRL